MGPRPGGRAEAATVRAISVAVLALLVGAGLALPSTAFHADDLPLVYATSTDGAGAWGVRVTNTGPMVLDLSAGGGIASSQLSGAVFLTDAAGNVLFGFAFTGHLSPDRQIVMVPQATDGTPPPGVSFTFDTQSTDAACTLFCLGLNFDAPGTQNMIVWIGGGATSSLEARGAVGSIAVKAGEAYVMGDAEFTGGLNVQVQETVADLASPAYITARAGVKVLRDTGATVHATQKVYGFFGASDFKLVCQFRAGACLWGSSITSTAEATCPGVGLSCPATAISYTGPNGGGSGSSLYALLGAPAGHYEFTVDSKVDVYGPSIYDPVSGSWLFLGENFSYLTVADASLP